MSTVHSHIDEGIRDFILQQKMFFVGSAPLDDSHIAFSNLRSPTTVSNIASNPAMEVNFSDLFARKAFRAKGKAEYIEKGTTGFDDLLPHFQVWEDLIPMIDGIVKLKIETASIILSPSYDIGLTEEGLREHWKTHYLKADNI